MLIERPHFEQSGQLPSMASGLQGPPFWRFVGATLPNSLLAAWCRAFQLVMEGGKAMKVQRFLVAIAMASVVGHAGAQILIQNTFDVDNQGWTSIGFSAAGTAFVSPSLTWVDGAGNPGGAVRYDSPINPPYTAFFLAPANVDTALHSAIGGSISWDLTTLHDPSATFLIGNGRSDIIIRAGTDSIRQIVTAPAGPPSDGSFAHYSLDFSTASDWRFNGLTTVATQAQIDAVLLNASTMLIRADYWDRNLPTSSILDNVQISAPIPEPETYAMLLAGLGLLGFAARRRKQKEAALA
jgi:hypothetical protein